MAARTSSSAPSQRARLDVHLVSLPTVDQLATGHDPDPDLDRQLVIVRLERADGAHGWGECSALNRPTYTAEWAEGAYDVLTATGPSSAGHESNRFEPDPVGHPMAAAALQMARIDLGLRLSGRSLAAELGATAETVTAGAVVGLGPVEEMAQSALELAAAGYRRLKCKVVPGTVAITLDAVADAARSIQPDLELQLDGNGRLTDSDLDELLALDPAVVSAIEQPFIETAIELSARLVAGTTIPIVADESVRSIIDAEVLWAEGALSGIAIKPPRVGGLVAAVGLLRWCQQRGVDACVGGMLESGLGRHALAAFAALDGLTITGDVSPARRWLADDPFPDLSMVDGMITVPTGPGICAEPDLELLDRYTLRHESIVLPTTEAT